MLMISGSMEYWYKKFGSDEEPRMVYLKGTLYQHHHLRYTLKNWKRW